MASIVIGIFAATIAGMFLGYLWYGPVFGTQWMRLVGLTPAAIKKNMARGAWRYYGVSVLANIVMATGLCAALRAASATGALSGLVGGVLAWSFVMATMAVNYRFADRPLRLYLIDAGHHLAVLAAMGLVLGALA